MVNRRDLPRKKRCLTCRYFSTPNLCCARLNNRVGTKMPRCWTSRSFKNVGFRNNIRISRGRKLNSLVRHMHRRISRRTIRD